MLKSLKQNILNNSSSANISLSYKNYYKTFIIISSLYIIKCSKVNENLMNKNEYISFNANNKNFKNISSKNKNFNLKILPKKKEKRYHLSQTLKTIIYCLFGSASIYDLFNGFNYKEHSVHILSDKKDLNFTYSTDYLEENDFLDSEENDYFLFPTFKYKVKNNFVKAEHQNNTSLNPIYENNVFFQYNLNDKVFNYNSNTNLNNTLIQNKKYLDSFSYQEFFEKKPFKTTEEQKIIRFQSNEKSLKIYKEKLIFENQETCKKLNLKTHNNQSCYLLLTIYADDYKFNIDEKNVFSNSFFKTNRYLLSTNYSEEYQHFKNLTEAEKCVYVKDIIELPKPDGMDCTYFIGVVWVGDYFVRYPIMILGLCCICCICRCIIGPCGHRGYSDSGMTQLQLYNYSDDENSDYISSYSESEDIVESDSDSTTDYS
ncbi:MAG: hypothetical protein GY830_09490 [Bacteroidetes bacterium]|nr:hypothetical protein [Bacteroidota bacterium]